MPAVIDSLRQEHVNMAKLLTLLERQVAIFESGARPDYDIMLGVVEYLRDWSDRWHHPKEDLVLDKLRQRDAAAADEVGELEKSHEALAELTEHFLEVIREVLREEELPRERVSGLAAEFIRSQRRHMEGEERVFLPAAERALTSEDWADIAMRMSNPEDPLFGREVEKRFEILRRDILAFDRDSAANA